MYNTPGLRKRGDKERRVRAKEGDEGETETAGTTTSCLEGGEDAPGFGLLSLALSLTKEGPACRLKRAGPNATVFGRTTY